MDFVDMFVANVICFITNLEILLLLPWALWKFLDLVAIAVGFMEILEILSLLKLLTHFEPIGPTLPTISVRIQRRSLQTLVVKPMAVVLHAALDAGFPVLPLQKSRQFGLLRDREVVLF